MNHPRFTPKDGDTKPCPQCRKVLSYESRHPVLSVGLALQGGLGANQVRHEPAWVCQNVNCDYRELLGDGG